MGKEKTDEEPAKRGKDKEAKEEGQKTKRVQAAEIHERMKVQLDAANISSIL